MNLFLSPQQGAERAYVFCLSGGGLELLCLGVCWTVDDAKYKWVLTWDWAWACDRETLLY